MANQPTGIFREKKLFQTARSGFRKLLPYWNKSSYRQLSSRIRKLWMCVETKCWDEGEHNAEKPMKRMRHPKHSSDSGPHMSTADSFGQINALDLFIQVTQFRGKKIAKLNSAVLIYTSSISSTLTPHKLKWHEWSVFPYDVRRSVIYGQFISLLVKTTIQK